MSAQKTVIIAEPRTVTTKGGIRKLRISGIVPGVIYGRKGTQAVSFAIKALPKGHTRASLVLLEIAGAQKTAFMREVQVDPMTDLPIHIDFQEVEPNELVKIRVPLEYVGLTREQEKEGSFKTLLRSIEVTAPASKVPSLLSLDVSYLKVDESAHLSDLKIPEGVKPCSPKNLALASLVRL